MWNFDVRVAFTAANNATCNLLAFIQSIDGVSILIMEFNVFFCDISFIGDENIVLSSFTIFLICAIFGLDNPPAFRWVIRVFLHVFALKRTFSCSSFLPSYQYCLNYHSFSTTTQEARTALGMLRTQVTCFKTLWTKLNFH